MLTVFEDGTLHVSLTDLTDEDIDILAEMAGEAASEDPEFAEEIEHMCDEIDVLCAAESFGIDTSELAHYGTSAGARLRWERHGNRPSGNGKGGNLYLDRAGRGIKMREDYMRTYGKGSVVIKGPNGYGSHGRMYGGNAGNRRLPPSGKHGSIRTSTNRAANTISRNIARISATNAARSNRPSINYHKNNAVASKVNTKSNIINRVGGAFRKLRSGKSTKGSRRAAAVRLASRIRGAFRGK